MANVFEGKVTLHAHGDAPRVQVFFGDAVIGAFNAWLFDPTEKAAWVREGNNQEGQTTEFFVGVDARETQAQDLKQHVLTIDGNALSPARRSDSYTVRLEFTQGGKATGRAEFRGKLNKKGTTAFTAYVTLDAA